MRGRIATAIGVLLVSGCSFGSSDDDLAALEDRVARLEARIATTTTTMPTTTTSFDIDATPPVTLPTAQAESRLLRQLAVIYSEPWEPEWCRANLEAVAEVAETATVDFPDQDWQIPAWIDANPDDFDVLCADAVALFDPAAEDPEVVADLSDALITSAVSDIVSEVALDSSDLLVVLEDMDEEPRDFCGASEELVYDAAFQLGRLPRAAADDLETYWAVTRPQEYRVACELAFGSR